MFSTWKRSFKETLVYEGGYVNHPKDPGGPTNLGITQATLSGWLGRQATIAEVKALTPDSVAPIYKKQYWDKVHGDDLPAGVDYAVYDYAVNSGVSRASKELQRVVGVDADGVIGLKTLAAVQRLDPATVARQLCDRRLAFLRNLRTWKTFGKGWGDRVRKVRASSVSITLGKAEERPLAVPSALPQPKASEADAKRKKGITDVLVTTGAVGTVVIEAIKAAPADSLPSIPPAVTEIISRAPEAVQNPGSLQLTFIVMLLIGVGRAILSAVRKA